MVGIEPSTPLLARSKNSIEKSPCGTPEPVSVSWKLAVPPGPIPGTTAGDSAAVTPSGTPSARALTSTGRVAAIVTACTMAFLSGTVPPAMLKTRGVPVESVAPVSSATADMKIWGELLGPTGFLTAVAPSAIPMTEIPSALRASIVP